MMRRTFDVVAALLGLLVLSPLFLVLALRIRLFDGGTVFYLSKRTGLLGREFNLLKFRTMFMDADRNGGGITVADDKRITPVGRFIRRYKLDELPQLINVILGEMNLVGPRPEIPKYTALYNLDQKQLLNIRPGITSPASLIYKNEIELLSGQNWEKIYAEKILPDKLEVDIQYFKNNTLFSDIDLILKTLLSVFQ